MSLTRRLDRRGLLALAAAAPFAAAAPAGAQPSGSGPTQAYALRSVVLQGVDGSLFRVTDPGPPLLFAGLWANWCAWCVTELPSIQRMADTLGPGTVRVVMISYPPNWEGDQEFARTRGIGLPLFTFAPGTADADVRAAFGASEGTYDVPQSLVLRGPGRRLGFSVRGPMTWDAPGMLSRLRGMAARSAPGGGFELVGS